MSDFIFRCFICIGFGSLRFDFSRVYFHNRRSEKSYRWCSLQIILNVFLFAVRASQFSCVKFFKESVVANIAIVSLDFFIFLFFPCRCLIICWEIMEWEDWVLWCEWCWPLVNLCMCLSVICSCVLLIKIWDGSFITLIKAIDIYCFLFFN